MTISAKSDPYCTYVMTFSAKHNLIHEGHDHLGQNFCMIIIMTISAKQDLIHYDSYDHDKISKKHDLSIKETIEFKLF